MTVILPERRQRRRYLTLKNAAIGGAAVVVAFILLSFWSGLRPAHSGSSSNLLEPRIPSSQSLSDHREPVMIVHEESVYDSPGAGPTLVDANAARVAAVRTAPPSVPATRQQGFEHLESQLGRGQRITISDGTGGVKMQVETTPAPADSQATEAASVAAPIPPPQPR
jgi:hypothetical protein